jgi:hypothetical protein
MPILQNLNQVTVRVTNHPGPLIAQHKKRRPQQKHANHTDVPDPETKPQPKRKKKNNQSNTK